MLGIFVKHLAGAQLSGAGTLLRGLQLQWRIGRQRHGAMARAGPWEGHVEDRGSHWTKKSKYPKAQGLELNQKPDWGSYRSYL